MCSRQNVTETQIKSRLFDAYFEGKNLDYLVSLLSDMLGNPVIVFDNIYKIISYSDRSKIKDIFWEKFIDQGYCTYEFITRISALPSVIKGRTSSLVYKVSCPESGNDKLVCPIILDSRLLGNIIVLGCQNPFYDGDDYIMENASRMIGEKIKNCGLDHKSENILSEELLFDLLEDRCSNRQELKDRMKLAKLNLPKKLQLLLFDLSGYKPEEVSTSRLKKMLEAKWNFYPSFFYKGNIVTICDFNKMKHYESEIADFNSKNSIFLSVSKPFEDLFLFHSYYLETLNSLIIGKCAYPEKNIFHYYETIYFYHLPNMSNEKVYDTFCHPALQKLLDYDELHHSDLYHTLYIYLLYEGNIQKTSQALFIHRNTVRYKIDKIISLTSIDLSNVLELSNIFFSYRIINYFIPDLHSCETPTLLLNRKI